MRAEITAEDYVPLECSEDRPLTEAFRSMLVRVAPEPLSLSVMTLLCRPRLRERMAVTKLGSLVSIVISLYFPCPC